MNRLGIEQLSTFAMPPVEYVGLAADLGCANISIGMMSHGHNPHNYPAWSLRDDAALRREMKAAMRDRGVRISLWEGLAVRTGVEMASHAEALDLVADLGTVTINCISMDPDLARTFDSFALMTEMVAERGMNTTTEFCPGLTIDTLPLAIEAMRHVGRDDFRLLIDTMHFGRTGASIEQLRALGPDRIGYVQIADANMAPKFDTYMEEAMYERMVPGTGEMPIVEILASTPSDRVVSVEVPHRGLADGGMGPIERIGPSIEATRRLIAEAEALV